ncbi:DNA gyrase inhibitor YacG [Salinisphaera sp.]|uniref:DNA gyrase inhibitor YacG n=1 Tax=Salinisphaera sp. TaxID=1914330 RepID=UPI002D77B6B0|nr:DNA gyrase inhibitor YacG [Salinisphaera sp.]HET7313170.1 DNA gyrase inhibitor YacG [Salinisphaera sp.]
MTSKQHAPCPQCGELADMTSNNSYRPFCSRRCKLIDLGDWLDESNRIPNPEGSADPSGLPPLGYGEDDSKH